MAKMIPSIDGHPDAVLGIENWVVRPFCRLCTLISRARHKREMHSSTGALRLMFRATTCGELNTLNSSQFYCKQSKIPPRNSATVEILYSTICADTKTLS
jgi:hypothetical protein